MTTRLPIGPPVSSQRIASALRAAILGGEYAPGTWLRQDDLAARFGASRLPVREALRIIQAEGLVETFLAMTGWFGPAVAARTGPTCDLPGWL